MTNSRQTGAYPSPQTADDLAQLIASAWDIHKPLPGWEHRGYDWERDGSTIRLRLWTEEGELDMVADIDVSVVGP